MNPTKEALVWITQILRKHHIPFQIAGGLAARAYGVTRTLVDIDIDIPEDDFDKIKNEVQAYIQYGPSQYQDEHWDLWLMTIRYHGQDIDLCGAYQTKVYDKKKKAWVTLKTDFSQCQYISIEGMALPIIAREALIAYKTLLARPVDHIDLAFLMET